MIGIRSQAAMRQHHGVSIASTRATRLGLVAMLSAFAPLGVQAQDVAPSGVNEVVVTGSRIVRDGYDAPTPLTVVGGEELSQQASPNVIDYMTSLPAFAGNYTPANSTTNISAGTAGVSLVNLRNMGTNRTLVLIDGQRSVGSTVGGRVDVNTIPQALIERVEVVTGGASAAYGSDAVSGVVNFILDKDYTGFKSEVSGGMTEYSDNKNYKVAMTFGTPFADGRGHFIVSGQRTAQDGVLDADREWHRKGWQIINNPDYTDTNGLPSRLLVQGVSPSNATPGGIIVHNPRINADFNNGMGNGTLGGVAFGPGGVPYAFNYGDIVTGSAMSGGEFRANSLRNTTSLEPELSNDTLFARVSFAVTDNINVFWQGNWNSNESFSQAFPHDLYYGGLRVAVGDPNDPLSGNPFLPANVRAAAQAQGLTELEMGSYFRDFGTANASNRRELLRNVIGVDGSFDAFNTNWTWDAYYQRGEVNSTETAENSARMSLLNNALNAVIDPNTGAITCAINLIDPTAGCSPVNPFGIGVNSQAALDYVMGIARRDQTFKQSAAGASISGTPFSNWAGSISVAGGIEYRKESVSGSSSEADRARDFFAGNYQATVGEYDVLEGFVETVVPLLAGVTGAQSLDLNAALRVTDYSTSGTTEAWKVGLTWAPIDDLRVRTTLSRDIRAPNLGDLYNAGTRNSHSVYNPATGNSPQYTGVTSGNPNLKPEMADSFGIGLVFQPAFLPGFNASVDYWSIDLEDAITVLSGQRIVDLCDLGNQQFCSVINGGQPLFDNTTASNMNTINIIPFNLASLETAGVDIEMSYTMPLLDGNLRLRAIGTNFLKNKADDTVTPVVDTVGQNTSDSGMGAAAGPPDWRWSASVGYSTDALNLNLAARGISAGVYNNNWIQCTSNCPVSTALNPTINNNRLGSAVYFDLSLAYTFLLGESESTELETFLNVKNLANRDPVIVAAGPAGQSFNTISTAVSNYDALGRVYMLGFRLRM